MYTNVCKQIVQICTGDREWIRERERERKMSVVPHRDARLSREVGAGYPQDFKNQIPCIFCVLFKKSLSFSCILPNILIPCVFPAGKNFMSFSLCCITKI